MKTLLLIRHAKAAWEELGTNDADRILTEQGLQQADLMGQELKTLQITPDLIVSSPAIRALNTAQILAAVLNYPKDKIKTEEKIYSGGVEDLINLIKQTNAKIDTLLLFGHNPNLTWLTHFLCEESHINIPTCGIIIISFENMHSWDQLTEIDGKLTHFIHPSHDQSHT